MSHSKLENKKKNKSSSINFSEKNINEKNIN
jgi:hypothetical protein